MKLHITITTYNRPAYLRALLAELWGQAREMNAQIVVFDDHSDDERENENICRAFGAELVSAKRRHGRERFWSWFSALLVDASYRELDYWIHLPDDVAPRPEFVASGLEQFQRLRRFDPKAVSLSPLRCKNWYHSQWTDVQPEKIGGVWRIGWNDLCWIADRRIGEALNWTIRPIDWATEPHTSSRVPAQISKRLHAQGYTMYGVDETLLEYGFAESRMNPEERALNPLTT